MENITLGDLSLGIALIVALLSGITVIFNNLKDWMSKAFKENFDGLDRRIDELSEQITTVDLEQTKSFLVRCLSDLEKGNDLGEVELQRFWEQYQHYANVGGNSYIKRRVEQLEKDGIL